MKNFKFYRSEKIHDLREMLAHSAKAYAKRPVFYEKENGEYQSKTYAKLYKDVQTLGAAFVRRGLMGKKVIVTGENGYAWAVTYLSVVCGLGVIVPVDKEIPAEELANIAKVSGASAIVFGDKYKEKAEAVGKKIQKYSFSDILDICEREDICSAEDFETYSNVSIDIDALAVLIFTSGTTGVSKGVMLSQRNICCNIENLGKLVKLDPEDVALSVLPLHHVYECTAGFLFPISRGAAVGYS